MALDAQKQATPAGRSGEWKPSDRLSSDVAFYSALFAAGLPTIKRLADAIAEGRAWR